MVDPTVLEKLRAKAAWLEVAKPANAAIATTNDFISFMVLVGFNLLKNPVFSSCDSK
jgi:hypothetical protein